MTSRDFCYWLMGLLEIANPESLSKEQVTVIRNHLNMVFYHEIDPSFGDPKEQEDLDQIHSGLPSNRPVLDSGSSGIREPRMKC